jgi:hypothetical protein
MDRSELPLMSQLLFGAGDRDLFLRADFSEPRRGELDPSVELRLEFEAPPGRRVTVRGLASARPEVLLDGETCGRAARDLVLELAVPRAALGLEPGARCAFRAELLRAGQSLQQVPPGDMLRFAT